jgi:hypothetical protein
MPLFIPPSPAIVRRWLEEHFENIVIPRLSVVVCEVHCSKNIRCRQHVASAGTAVAVYGFPVSGQPHASCNTFSRLTPLTKLRRLAILSSIANWFNSACHHRCNCHSFQATE